jgi:hypothetical protein
MVDSSYSLVRSGSPSTTSTGRPAFNYSCFFVFICLVLLSLVFHCRFLISADFSPFLDLPLLSLPPLMPCLSASFVNELCQRALDEQMLISSTN